MPISEGLHGNMVVMMWHDTPDSMIDDVVRAHTEE